LRKREAVNLGGGEKVSRKKKEYGVQPVPLRDERINELEYLTTIGV
jgi:hypothetical protein